MIEITLSTPARKCEEDIPDSTPIFAKDENGELVGMVVKEDDGGWITRIGGAGGASGYHETRRACMNASIKYNWTFHIEG